jgi:MFS transporter, DHA2 family, multidrug resistance protein
VTGGPSGPPLPPVRPGLGDLAPIPRALTAVALALGTFMQVLDTTIANVSIPTIAGDLGISTDQGTWVITSFTVANGISLPLAAWLMQRFGIVRTSVLAIAMFTIASLLCGLAWDLPSLLVFRVLQGAVSGPMIPGSQALLLLIFPPQRRAFALAIWSITTLVAPVVGPILGGYISDNYSWPWIFLINVPVGILSAFVCWRFIGSRDTPTRRLPVDRVGIALLVVWVGALQVLLDKGRDADWFESPLIIVLGLVAAVAFAAFLIWELTERYPIVDLTLFRMRNFSIGTAVLCVGYAVFLANVVLYPLWLQTQLGYTATWAGLVSAPSGAVAVVLMPILGRLFGRFDARWFLTLAMLAFGASYLMRAGLTTDAALGNLVAPMLVQGLAMSTFFVAVLQVLLHRVPAERIPAASGMSNFLRITAGSFGASIVTTFWDRHAAFHQARLAEHSSALDPTFGAALTHLQSLGLSQPQAIGVLTGSMVGQAHAKAALDFFWISGWIALALIALVWLAQSTSGASHGPKMAAD